MNDRAAPLVPADVDLRSYDWFPFFHKRLRHSAFWKRATDLACRISVDFWSEAYEQVPAGSIPDDDYLLADWAGFGRRDISGWLAVKAEVMSAWTLCCDGRWYHPTLSEVARQAWSKRRVELWKRECDRIRKENRRRADDGLDPLPIPEKPEEEPETTAVADDHSDGSQERAADDPQDIQPPSVGFPPDVQRNSSGRPSDKCENPAENSLRETVTVRSSLSLRSREAHVTRENSDRPPKKPPRPRKSPRSGFPTAEFEVWYGGYPHKVDRGAAERAFDRVFRSGDVTLDQLVAARDAYIAGKPPDRPWCNPATWLNGRRWLDRPADPRGNADSSNPSLEPRVDLGGGIHAPHSTIRNVWSRGKWPGDWGPRPDEAGCRISSELMRQIMTGRAAA